ncbi:uncharacterized protein LOC134816135 [Bolinopsis microptera]|uniref:uncharacterized protein LOC134816135 n=1 Tax=Bolinopsis microptera TaxID=2820187 RepID=UPI0030795343
MGTVDSPIKLVATFVGYNGAGKTTLLYKILDRPLPPNFVPKVLPWDEGPLYLTTRTEDGREVHLHVRDTCVLDEYDRFRPLNFPQTDVFVICFPNTLDLFWRDEIVRCGFQEVPVVLLKTKVDEVSSDNMEKQVCEEDVELSKDKVGWLYSLEVSVQNEMLVKELVSKIVLAGLSHQKTKVERKKRRCVVL